MQTVAITFFSTAALLSLVLIPNSLALLPLLFVSAARTVALALALLFWVASGRLDTWGSSRLGLSLLTLAGVVLLSFGCFNVQMARNESVPALASLVYCVIAGLLPVCFVAGALLPSRNLFLIASVAAPVAGVLVVATWKPLHAQYEANTPQAKRQREYQASLARRMSELDRVPDTAGVQPLLAFVTPGEFYEVRRKAQERIEKAPDWIAQLSAMLEGGNRLNALYALSQTKEPLPDAVVERSWSAAASTARDGADRLKTGSLPAESDQQMLVDSVVALGSHSQPARQRHSKEIVTVRDFLSAAKTPINTGPLDLWVRESQLRSIPESSGIEPLLEFTAPGEVWAVKQEALSRIPNTPESMAKLAKVLDGPHRLDALVVLTERADGLTDDLREHCWRAAGLTATEMAGGIEQGNPPTRAAVRKLYRSAGVLWTKSGSPTDEHLTIVATVRDVVRAAGDDWDKIDFGWADRALASAAQAQSSGDGK